MRAPRAALQNELVFLPLGGLGEIGMNCALYGFGPEDDRRWIMVDCGVTFASEEHEPGVDLIYPDLTYVIEERARLLGIIITHAHEDHIGALVDLWPRLRTKAPVFMTAFARSLLEAKRGGESKLDLPIRDLAPGARIALGPFDIEPIGVAHSIPESLALALRTPLGTVVHTGDWKIDETPTLGWRTDFERLRAIGDEGVRALVCDSTNVVREGISPSEREVSASLADLIRTAKQRVAITTFASNVGRIRSIAEAARANDRHVVVLGRAMWRAVEAARELGYLDGLPEFLDEDVYGHLPRDKVVLVLTGSQGEPRAALARIAANDHRSVAFSPGDIVVFSSRTIPGNEKAVGGIINALARQGVEIVTDRDGLVHVSGHPRRDELAAMYRAVRPELAIPAHGEALHLALHAKFAKAQGVPEAIVAKNGDIVRLAPHPAAVVDEAPTGRLYRDGDLILPPERSGLVDRRRAAFAGVVSIGLVLDHRGEMLADPEVSVTGLPEADAEGTPFREIVEEAALGCVKSIPRARRKDRELVTDAMRRAVRAAVGDRWGKKPVCVVLLTTL